MLDPLEQRKAQPQLADLLAPLFEWVEQQALRIKALETELAQLRAQLCLGCPMRSRPAPEVRKGG